ncbi:hypothetical protein DSM104329_05603 [Capillimicrobium parvum]|uniref:Uncharacterized protein n=1 Tax=Capillimicrobium parvum TaxID=2884022 RepID=A0A9E6Y7J8_9ACTN|nr:hypothetical protein DSM104329_05603 [Capillimicrobium parvum]
MSAAGLLLAGCGGGDAGAGTVPGRTEPTPAASQPAVTAAQPGVATRKPDQIVDIRPPQEGRPSLFLVGDSLGVGMARDLQADLPGWTVSVDVRNGLVAGIGMPLWRAQQTPYTVSAFSLFTNDDPANLAGLEQVVRESVERVFSQCAIWATIRAPPRNGVTFDAANALLHRLAGEYPGRLFIVPWAETVTARSELDLGDYVHATDEGYAVRARLFAEAARRCVRQAA